MQKTSLSYLFLWNVFFQVRLVNVIVLLGERKRWHPVEVEVVDRKDHSH